PESQSRVIRLTRHHLLEHVFCVIGTANQRTGKDPANTESAADLAEFRKLIGMVVSLDFSVFYGRPQILPDREDIDAGLDRILHQPDDFVLLFSEPNHDPR